MGYQDARRESGLYSAQVLRAEQVSPHLVRVTVKGDDITRLPQRGFDHWFRLFLPRPEGNTAFDNVPDRFGLGGYLKYLRLPAGTRPVVRNYTVREHRVDAGELDIDFVVHGEVGIAGRWARDCRPGETIALIDQGVGFDLLPDADFHLLVGEESALPAICGILRDLPRDARGLAVIEVPDASDAQATGAPDGVEVRWLVRTDPHAKPGQLALQALRQFTPERPATLSAYLAGEQNLPTQGRRHLVAAGVPKSRISFTGYWRQGKAAGMV